MYLLSGFSRKPYSSVNSVQLGGQFMSMVFARLLTSVILPLALAKLLVVPTHAADRVVTFKAAAGDVLSPERGFYRSYTNSFAMTVDDELTSVRGEGATLIYAPVRLDGYRGRDLTQAFLTQLETKFASPITILSTRSIISMCRMHRSLWSSATSLSLRLSWRATEM
jgi:hypothetical protein